MVNKYVWFLIFADQAPLFRVFAAFFHSKTQNNSIYSELLSPHPIYFDTVIPRILSTPLPLPIHDKHLRRIPHPCIECVITLATTGAAQNIAQKKESPRRNTIRFRLFSSCQNSWDNAYVLLGMELKYFVLSLNQYLILVGFVLQVHRPIHYTLSVSK